MCMLSKLLALTKTLSGVIAPVALKVVVAMEGLGDSVHYYCIEQSEFLFIKPKL